MKKINEIKRLIYDEEDRQENEICLIASENYMSKDVLDACGSVFINKYAEGYSGHRYYGGCSIVDKIEDIANEEARELFNCKWSNVQPNSGSQANQAVYLALLKPGDTILGMDLNAGGHLTHGCKASSSGKLYNAVSYGLDENGYINYNEIKENLYEHRPALLIVGASAYPRIIDFKRIREIVDEYNEWQKENDLKNAKLYNEGKIADLTPESYPQYKHCYYMVDMAHIAGLVATGLHPSPLPYADVVTSTVQKTLRSGRGGLILSNDEELGKKIDKAVFPGIQGGPLVNMIAGKAVGFNEALQPEFKNYQEQVLKNIQTMVKVFEDNDVKMISGGSDNHLILLDLREEVFSGADLEKALEEVGIIVNKNAVQNDPKPKMETSGVRIGTAAITTRGAKEDDAREIAYKICMIIDLLSKNLKRDSLYDAIIDSVKEWVKDWCEEHPIYEEDEYPSVSIEFDDELLEKLSKIDFPKISQEDLENYHPYANIMSGCTIK